MASRVVPKGTGISVQEATRQFYILFDEYSEIDQPSRVYGMANATGFDQNVRECAEEVDEVYIDSATNPDQKEVIHQLAEALAQLGDRYNAQFGNDMEESGAVTVLSSLFTQAKGLEYKTFEGTMGSLVTGHDRNVAEFAFIMCVSKKVASQVGNVACSFFRQYIGNSYADVFAKAGGVQQFMNQPLNQ